MAEHYDLIIVGSGAGGGTLAHRLAPSGKRVLILERGDWLPREAQNWDAEAVFVQTHYVSTDRWFDRHGKAFQPQVHYFVGGATKFYGAALYRLRERDFGEIKHHDGISPAWPIGYDVMEPYYTQAEQLYQVHGARGQDPTDPPASAPYPFPPISHEPRIQRLFDDMTAVGLHPFHSPSGVMLDESHPAFSACIRCATCDGFPCLVNAKSRAAVRDTRCRSPRRTGPGRRLHGCNHRGDVTSLGCAADRDAALSDVLEQAELVHAVDRPAAGRDAELAVDRDRLGLDRVPGDV